MTRFQVDSDRVAAATAQVQGSLSRLQAEVGGLNAALADLDGSWTGTAASAFQLVYADWRATQLRLEETLAGFGRALAFAGRQYDEVETSNARMFAG